MSGGDALWGSLTRAATEAGRMVRGAAEEAAKEISGVLGRNQQKLRWPGGRLLEGPIIPQSYKVPGQVLTWQDGYMASCVVSMAKAVKQHQVQPATMGLAAVQVALHMRPGGYRLLQVGLNSHRVLQHREWRRLGTSALLHSDPPHLVSNCTALVLEGLPLEARLGTPRFLGLVASTGLLTQALYLLSTRLAADWLPKSALANDYFFAYSVGFSGIAMALKVVGGYMREADLAAARVVPSEEFVLTAGRLGAWPSLLLAHYLVPGASLAGHLSGVAAGLLHVYSAALLGWLRRRLRQRRRLQGGRLVVAAAAAWGLGCEGHPGLGWLDLGSHLVLGAGACLALRWASSSKGGCKDT